MLGIFREVPASKKSFKTWCLEWIFAISNQHIIRFLFQSYSIFILLDISYLDMLNTFYHIHLGPVFVWDFWGSPIHTLHPCWFSHLLRFVNHGLVQGSLSMEIRSIHLCTWRYSLDSKGCVLVSQVSSLVKNRPGGLDVNVRRTSLISLN